MTILRSTLDPDAEDARAARQAMLDALDEIAAETAKAVAGGGDKAIARHHARGKMTARERIELLLDEDAPFLELAALAGYGSQFTVGGSVVAGIGVVSGVECLLLANDPTVKGGASNPWSLRKTLRMHEIAMRNRLPVIALVESGGADLPTQKEVFIPGGAVFRNLTRLSAAGIPTIALVFGNSTAGGAYLPGHERPRGDDREAVEGVPGRPAAGQGGHRRGVRRRVAGRRRDARPGVRPGRPLRPRRAGRHPDRPADRRPPELAQGRRPDHREPRSRRGTPPRTCCPSCRPG